LSSKQLTFIQAGIASGNGGESRRTTINLGIGHRLLVEDDMAIAGINFFTDYESKSKHKRLSSLFVLIPLILTSLRPAPNVFKNVLALSLTKPSVLLMAWFLILLYVYIFRFNIKRSSLCCNIVDACHLR
jgi:hypothetical protein